MKILATKEDISITRALIADTKAELIEWMFILWIGLVVVTFGFMA